MSSSICHYWCSFCNNHSWAQMRTHRCFAGPLWFCMLGAKGGQYIADHEQVSLGDKGRLIPEIGARREAIERRPSISVSRWQRLKVTNEWSSSKGKPLRSFLVPCHSHSCKFPAINFGYRAERCFHTVPNTQ